MTWLPGGASQGVGGAVPGPHSPGGQFCANTLPPPRGCGPSGNHLPGFSQILNANLTQPLKAQVLPIWRRRPGCWEGQFFEESRKWAFWVRSQVWTLAQGAGVQTSVRRWQGGGGGHQGGHTPRSWPEAPGLFPWVGAEDHTHTQRGKGTRAELGPWKKYEASAPRAVLDGRDGAGSEGG